MESIFDIEFCGLKVTADMEKLQIILNQNDGCATCNIERVFTPKEADDVDEEDTQETVLLEFDEPIPQRKQGSFEIQRPQSKPSKIIDTQQAVIIPASTKFEATPTPNVKKAKSKKKAEVAAAAITLPAPKAAPDATAATATREPMQKQDDFASMMSGLTLNSSIGQSRRAVWFVGKF